MGVIVFVFELESAVEEDDGRLGKLILVLNGLLLLSLEGLGGIEGESWPLRFELLVL